MAKYRKKQVVIEATRWWSLGDHKEVIQYEYPLNVVSESVGIPNDYKCDICKRSYAEHGWMNTLEGASIVCPGDWIITDKNGVHSTCKSDIFEKTYEKI